MKIVQLLLVGLLQIQLIHGQTTLPDTIVSNTTLVKTGSPYLVVYNMVINPGVTLTIEPGVVVKIANLATITVYGNLIAIGNPVDSIYFQSISDIQVWNTIASDHANIEISFVKVTEANMLLSASGGDNIKITHCNIISLARGYGMDCIAVHDASRVTIEYITLKGNGGKISEGIKNDAIDLDNVDSCFIRHNQIFNFSDDAIDIGTNTKYALISDNIVHNSNYGVTVGESSIAYLDNITSYNNDGGIQVHTGATIYCHNNTLYSNTAGVECYHSEEGETKQTGGIAFIKNTIFSQSTEDITKQSSSSVTISYSLSDKETLPGDSNLMDDPMLTDPANGNFRLMTGSPCFNAGEPDSNYYRVNIGVFQLPDSVSAINGVENYSASISVYPNPAEDILFIKIPFKADVKYVAMIYDMTGRLILSNQIDNELNSLSISDFASGIYIIQVNSSNCNYSDKFTKK